MRIELVQSASFARAVPAQGATLGRQTWIRSPIVDVGRGLSILLLLLVVCAGTPNPLHPAPFDIPLKILAIFAAPAFFLLSGLCAASDLRLPWLTFLRRHVVASVWVLPLWIGLEQNVGWTRPGSSVAHLVHLLGPFMWVVSALPFMALFAKLLRTVPLSCLVLAALLFEASHIQLTDNGFFGAAAVAAYFIGSHASGLIFQFARQSQAHATMALSGAVALLAFALLMQVAPAPLAEHSRLSDLPFIGFGLALAGACILAILAARLIATDFGFFLQSIGSHWGSASLTLIPAVLGVSAAGHWMGQGVPSYPMAQLGLVTILPAFLLFAPRVAFESNMKIVAAKGLGTTHFPSCSGHVWGGNVHGWRLPSSALMVPTESPSVPPAASQETIQATMTTPPRPIGPGDHLFLVDGSNFIFRAYFQSIRQDQKYNYRSDRLPTGAVRLFATKIFQFVRDGAAGIKPTHLAIIFDKSENSFRKELYPAYKGNRSEPPEDLVPQFPLMRRTVQAFGLIPIEQDRYEADDLIATYAKQARERGADVLIVSADKDLMQLVGPNVAMFDPASGQAGNVGAREERRIGEAEVIDYFGVPPSKVIDVQALAGDSTDNVPGAPGIGIKTAAQLIEEYGDLDTLLARAGEIKQPKRRETLTNPETVELIRVSKKLVTLCEDVDLQVSIDDLTLPDPDPKTLVAFLKAMEFTTITRRAAEIYDVDPTAVEPDPDLIGPGGWRGRDGAVKERAPEEMLPSQSKPNAGETAKAGALVSAIKTDGEPSPKSFAAARASAAQGAAIDRAAYESVSDLTRLQSWVAEARENGFLAVDTETSSLDPMQADLVGVSLAIAPGRACYIPLGHRGQGSGGELFGDDKLVDGQMPIEVALAVLKPLLEDKGVLKIGQNMKFDWLMFARYGIEVAPTDDTMLLSYVLDAGVNGHGMDELSTKHLGHKTIPFGEVAGTGKNFIGFARVAIDKASEYAAEDADVTLRLWNVLKPRLAAEQVATVYERLERPMVETLARMERRGISIDRQILSRLSGEFAQGMARLEAEIHELAGEPFNLGSPKQLGDILFGKMGLPGGKKTATGAWSTSASVLDELAEQGNELAAQILEWRQLAKLKSTYTDALPNFVNPQTKRVHTSFALAATTTGRLSSSEPNLQNIPVRNEAGRKIRTAFIATPGHKLISADYSQIELRILAHMADIPQLRQAFADGLDIHAMTASEMFGVPVKDMPGDVRRRAKAINFGIIYGISAFGLANQLGIPREEAGAYIRKYFERFPGIRDYMDATKKLCREQGFVTTIFGRKCHYPRINASNPAERAFNERAAINAPIQGSAADIIRRAMVRMDDALAAAKLDAQMLLQVHDELVFEVPDAQVEATIDLVRKVMIDAPHPAIQLAVPLQVDARAAQNWDEAH